MAREEIIIEITGSQNDVLWYREKIGQRFIVFDEDSKKNTYSLKVSGHISRIIYKDDAKIIRKNNQKK